MAENGEGPWGRGKRPEKKEKERGKRPDTPPTQVPEIDELMRKGQDQLRAIMGGKGGGSGGSGGSSDFKPPSFRRIFSYIFLGALVLWGFASIYRVDTSEQSVELIFGAYSQTGTEGLNFAPWPVVTKEVLAVTPERIIDIGVDGDMRLDAGLMLTGDENIVDIDFQVVWNISDLRQFFFNLAAPEETIRAVAASAMREIIARSNLAPILNRDRGVIVVELEELIQTTLDSYESGVNIVRVNFDKADPPLEVIDAFREVQAAEQTRDTLEKQADAYANRVMAEARGKAAQLMEEAEGYRAQVINGATGDASRFSAVYTEYKKAPEVTRKRLYLETLERVMASVDKIIVDDALQGNGQGVVSYLPLNEIRKSKGEK